MRDEDILRKAASMLGRKGGKATGKSKARTGISERMKKWWASPAAAHRRKKSKPKALYAQENYESVNPHPAHKIPIILRSQAKGQN